MNEINQIARELVESYLYKSNNFNKSSSFIQKLTPWDDTCPYLIATSAASSAPTIILDLIHLILIFFKTFFF